MTPVEPREHLEGTRTAYIGPNGSGIEPLPAVFYHNEVRTEWDLSFDERAAILDGARVILTFRGSMPPCRIEVEGVDEVSRGDN